MSLHPWFVGKYNKWDKVDPAELFSQAPTEKKEANPKLNMVKFLQVRGPGWGAAARRPPPGSPCCRRPAAESRTLGQGGLWPEPCPLCSRLCERPLLAHISLSGLLGTCH